MTERSASRLLLAPDARAAERALLEAVEAAQADNPLARILIVVPSRQLRLHLQARILGRRPATLGVELVSLRALTRAVLARTRSTLPDPQAAELLLPLLVERLASKESALAGALAELDDGYGGVAGVVRDLYDAGFVDETLDVGIELLQEERAALGSGAVERAQAILRVAARARKELSKLALSLESDRMAAATEAISVAPERAVPAARVVIYGFTDATGVASDLLSKLFQHLPTTAILPVPPALDPASPEAWRFGARLRERFQGLSTPARLPAVGEGGTLKLSSSLDAEREVRDIVDVFAGIIAGGTRPERMAIVARDLAPYRSAFEREIDRRAVPASGSSGGEHPAARFARAWLELLEDRGEATLELVLAAGPAWPDGSQPTGWELRGEAARHGVRRLRELATERGTGGSSSPHPALAEIRRRARRLLGSLDALAKRQPLGAIASRLAALIAESSLEGEIRERLLSPLSGLEREPLAAFVATPEEARRVLARLWSEIGSRPLGGDGGGVALLSVTEARALSFDRLAILGLARDRFPRRVSTDPFLPDALRNRLRALLPDLPVKGEGHDEERFLFAQLICAAPEVVLSVPARDAGGQELARSALLDEIGRAAPLQALERPVAAPSPAIDRAIAESLTDAALGPSFARAVVEAGERFGDATGAGDAVELAKFRGNLLAELSADPTDAARRDRLGPFFGFVGNTLPGRDPRRDSPSVTALESLAGCGWRTFLERLLRVAPPTVPADELPSLPARLAGSTLHDVLERIGPSSIHRGTLTEALARAPHPVAWPEEPELQRLLEEAAARVLRHERIDPELFTLPLARAARELLAEVQAIDWPGGARTLLGVEVEGLARVETTAGSRTLRFRVDRCEREPSVGILLTDYKSGKPLSSGKKEETRTRALGRALATGESLQLASYALAQLDPPERVTGRLLFAKPGLAEEARDLRLATGDERLAEVPWTTLFEAWDRGSFLPRLLETDLSTPWKGCDWCDVRVACIQGDSGARLRLRRWTEAQRAGAEEPDVTMNAARALFALQERAKAATGSRTAETAAGVNTESGEDS